MAYALLQWPWRKSLEDHLYSFRRYGKHSYHYVNLAVPGLALPYAAAQYDAIVWHTSFLSWLRWSPDVQQRGLLGGARRIKDCAPVRVALPQDEFLRSDRINAVLTELGVQHVFSVAPPSEWPKIYDGLDRDRVGLSRVLTGYLDTETLERTSRILGEDRERTIDIGYRTVPAKPYLGRHAMLKADIADVIRERAEARGLRVDISTKAEDTFYGDDWYRFLASCRYTIGIEGGASILDRDGSVRACVDGRLEERPEAGFDELEAACFPGRDGELELYAISPRHLEACATRTAQILVEGDYAGILQPGVHYTALRRDLSNLDEVLDRVASDGGAAARLSQQAYTDVVASGEYTYRRLVEQVERELPAPSRERSGRPATAVSNAVDALTRPLIPLATRTLMPVRRRVLGAAGTQGYRSGGRTPRLGRKPVGGVLVIYDRPITPFHRDASTVVEHASSFGHHSALGVVEVNADAGFPPGLEGIEFDAIILHYSLFGMARYRLDEGFLRYLRGSDAYKVAFFQDEYFACQRRFAFLNEYEIDCVYTCLEPSQFDQVYGALHQGDDANVDPHGLRERSPARSRRPLRSARRRAPRGRRIPGSPAPRLPRARSPGEDADRRALCRARRRQWTDASTSRAPRRIGSTGTIGIGSWPAVAACSAWSREHRRSTSRARFSPSTTGCRAEGRPVGVDDLQTLERWDYVVDLRTISPRHFEAAAFRVCPVLFEGRYAGVPGTHGPLHPAGEGLLEPRRGARAFRDADLRRELTENAHRDLIASGRYSYDRFVEGVDSTLIEGGVQPLRERAAAEEAIRRGERLRRGRTQMRYVVNGVDEHAAGTPAARDRRPGDRPRASTSRPAPSEQINT